MSYSIVDMDVIQTPTINLRVGTRAGGVAMNTGTTPGLICFHQEFVSSDEFLDHPHLMGFY